jgi:hypothetical protein
MHHAETPRLAGKTIILSEHEVFEVVVMHCYFQGVILTPKSGVTKKKSKIIRFLGLK